ncbi:MAG TPA: hypothetical protein VIS75_00865, partial [Chitinophagaceae bacterium]
DKKIKKTAPNKGFSAMLASEHILIVILIVVLVSASIFCGSSQQQSLPAGRQGKWINFRRAEY